jgi:ABC-type Fe3+/spermidine/putrescine transport system ATPase subunit
MNNELLIKRERNAKQVKEAQRQLTTITNYLARFGNLNIYEPTDFEKQALLEIKKSLDYYIVLLNTKGE